MKPAQRIWAALRGEPVDRTPFSVYEVFLSQTERERQLRNKGMCILRRLRSYRIEYRGVEHRETHFWQKGKRMVRTVFETPHGPLSTLQEETETSLWTREHLFKSPEDYRRLLFLIEAMEPVPDYPEAERIIEECGDDLVIRDNLPLEPLQHLISSYYMDMTDFCYEWEDHRKQVMQLYEAFLAFNRKVYPIVAKSPARIANYGGNVIPQLIGRKGFEDLYMPHYREAADLLHAEGKLIGCHFDGDNATIMDLIARTPLDYIEAYDPGISPPVRQALEMFKGKALWINFPSAWHLYEREEVADLTRGLLAEVAGHPRFLLGVTEDIPADRLYTVLFGITDGIDAMT